MVEANFNHFFKEIIFEVNDYFKNRINNKIIVNRKEKDEYVSQVDHDIDDIILKHISKNYPDHNVLTEEKGYTNRNSEFTWFIDPIDNTVDLINYRDMFCVSVSLMQNNDYLASFIYFPERNEYYFAFKSSAYLNEDQLTVSHSELNERIKPISTCVYAGDKTLEKQSQIIHQLYKTKQPIRISGSAASDLALVASGKHLAHISMGAHDWDICAGLHLVKAAGGSIEILSERENYVKSFIAANNFESLMQLKTFIS